MNESKFIMDYFPKHNELIKSVRCNDNLNNNNNKMLSMVNYAQSMSFSTCWVQQTSLIQKQTQFHLDVMKSLWEDDWNLE